MRAIVVCFFLCLLWMCCLVNTAAGQGVTDHEILIGVSNAQEGPAKFLGRELNRGALAYFHHINKTRGGVWGRKIRTIQYDDGYEPEKCIKNTTRLLDKDKVFCLFGYVGTPTTRAVGPIVAKQFVPFYFPFTGAEFLREVDVSPTVFNLRATYYMETEALVAYLVNNGIQRIAIFYQDDSYGRAGLQGVERALFVREMELVGKGTYTRNTTAVNQALISIKRSDPEAIIMVGTYKPCAEFIKRAKRLGLDNTLFLNISFVGSKALLQELGDQGEGVIVSQVAPLPWDTSNPAIREYQEIMNKSYQDFSPGFVSLEGFLDAKLLVAILQKAGKELTRKAVLQATKSVNGLDLGLGVYIAFGEYDHQGLDKVFLTVIRNNRFENL